MQSKPEGWQTTSPTSAEAARVLFKRWKDGDPDTQYGDTMLCLRRGEPTENNAWTRLTSSFVATFAKAGKEEFSSRSKEKHETPAHVFDVAHGAVDALRATKQNQAIVVLGDGGLSTAALVQCLLGEMSNNKDDGLMDKLMAAQTLLSAFTNVQGDRESLLVTELFFDLTKPSTDRPTPVGAHVTNLSPSTAISNFDIIRPIFYYLFYGLSDTSATALRLRRGGKIPTLISKDIKEVDFIVGFNQVLNAMDRLSISEEERSGIFSVLSGLLFLSCVNPSGCNNAPPSKPGMLPESEFLEYAAANLGVDKDALNALLITYHSMTTALSCKRVRRGRPARSGTGVFLNLNTTGRIPRAYIPWRAAGRSNNLIEDIYGRLVFHVVDLVNRGLHSGMKSEAILRLPHISTYEAPQPTVTRIDRSDELACLKRNHAIDRLVCLLERDITPPNNDKPIQFFSSCRHGGPALQSLDFFSTFPHKVAKIKYIRVGDLKTRREETAMILEDTDALLRTSEIRCLACLFSPPNSGPQAGDKLASRHPPLFEDALADIVDGLQDAELRFVLRLDPSVQTAVRDKKVEVPIRKQGLAQPSNCRVSPPSKRHAVTEPSKPNLSHLTLWLKFIPTDGRQLISCHQFVMKYGRLIRRLNYQASINHEQNSVMAFHTLPIELVHLIFDMLPNDDLMSVSQTCREFQRVALPCLNAVYEHAPAVPCPCGTANISLSQQCSGCQARLNPPSNENLLPSHRSREICEAFLSAASKSKKLATILQHVQLLENGSLLVASAQTISALDQLMIASDLAPYPPRVVTVNQKWNGSRFLSQGLDVEEGESLLMIACNPLNGYARCIPLPQEGHQSYRISGWLPCSLFS